jgi:hypothetical protein
MQVTEPGGSPSSAPSTIAKVVSEDDTADLPPFSSNNEVRFWLSVLAYNLGNLWRRLVLPQRIDGWSLTSLL